MNEDGWRVNNTADGAAGIQAGGSVHNSNVYQTLPDDPPERRYEVGVRHLDDGNPSRARELIAEAMERGHDNSEVRFHWVLALLSKRAYRDLTPDEREQLARTEEKLGRFGTDEWTQALKVIYKLLHCLRNRQLDPGPVLENELHSLKDTPRGKIIHHLEHVLTGSMKANFWTETVRAANEGRYANDREGRVWAYFMPDPALPDVRRPIPNRTDFQDWVLAVVWSIIAAASTGYLGLLVISQARALSVLAYLIAIATGCVGARTGLEWRYRWRRLQVKDDEYFGQPGVNRAPEGRFASSIGLRFDYYFAKHIPRNTSRDEWLGATAGIRRTLRDEVAELYREKRTAVRRTDWLTRYLVREVKWRWERGTLWHYREQYRIAPRTKLLCMISLAVFIAAALTVVVSAAQTAPFTAVLTALILLLSDFQAATRWRDISYELRRIPEDQLEADRDEQDRTKEYERWKSKLESIRPSENEMERWLTADMTMLLDGALAHYHLPWRDVLTHAFLLTPSKDSQRARVARGPWRYSKYDVRLFLITQDGVRESRTVLDFRNTTFQREERNNYRFDAVSSVYVAKRSDYGHELKLTLTNGPSHDIQVADLEMPQAEPDEDAGELTEMNPDNAGFVHTLHILEGIAAEGKGWLDRGFHVNGERPK